MKAYEKDNFVDELSDPLSSITRALLDGKENPIARIDQFEIDCRKYLLEQLQQPSTDRIQALGEYWKSVTEVCLHCLSKEASKDLNVRKIPIVLLEDMIDTLSTDECSQLWDVTVEANGDLLFENVLWNPDESNRPCWLPFLKATNKWIRKVPPKVASAILIKLSNVYPISEKSSIKVWGSHNTENVTEFDEEEMFQANVDEAVPTSKLSNYSTYHSFWTLQEDFGNPNNIKVADFLERLEVCVAAFEGQHQMTEKAASVSPTKYLTGSRLLHIQLANPEFMIHIMTQLIICAFHLSSQVPVLELRLAPFVKRAKALIEKVETGKHHLDILDRILNTSETSWREWKKSKCAIDLDQPVSQKPAAKRRRLGEMALNDGEDEDMGPLDSVPITEVADKMSPPEMDEFMRDYVDALDPEAGIEPEYHPRNDKTFNWRAFRLLRRHHLGKFESIRSDGDFEKAVRVIYEAKGVEIPGEAPSDLEESDHEQDVEEVQEDVKGDEEASNPPEDEEMSDVESVKEEDEAEAEDKDMGEDNAEDAEEDGVVEDEIEEENEDTVNGIADEENDRHQEKDEAKDADEEEADQEKEGSPEEDKAEEPAKPTSTEDPKPQEDSKADDRHDSRGPSGRGRGGGRGGRGGDDRRRHGGRLSNDRDRGGPYFDRDREYRGRGGGPPPDDRRRGGYRGGGYRR